MAAALLGLLGIVPWWVPSTSMVLIPSSYYGGPLVSVVILPCLFWLWSYGLFRGAATIPVPSIWAVGCAFLASGFWYAAHWSDLLPLDPFINLFALLILCALVGISRRRPAFLLNAVFHWLSFVWFISVAFPFPWNKL